MRTWITAIVMVVVLCGQLCLAQELFTMDDDGLWQKASNVHRLSQFPKIHKDGRVWFQFEAPQNAISVKLQIGRARHDIQKDTDGRWNMVIPSPEPEFQIYSFNVDGTNFIDPGSKTYYVNGVVSVMEVPSPGEDFYHIKNVPYGDVREHWFYSEIEHKFRRSFMYTLAEYEQNPSKRYPVLYLQHGATSILNYAATVRLYRESYMAKNFLVDGREGVN